MLPRRDTLGCRCDLSKECQLGFRARFHWRPCGSCHSRGSKTNLGAIGTLPVKNCCIPSDGLFWTRGRVWVWVACPRCDGAALFSLLKAAFLFVRKRGGKWEEKSPPLRSDTLRHATFHRFSQKGRGGRVKQVTHRWPRACFMSLPCLVPRPPAGILSKNI